MSIEYDIYVQCTRCRHKHEEVAVSELAAKITAAHQVNQRNAAARTKLGDLRTQVSKVRNDIAALELDLGQAEQKNQAARALAQRETLRAQLETLENKAETYSLAIEQTDADKAARVAAATFPVDGLAFGDGTVTYNGLPLEQASMAEQIRISLAMAMAMNPQIRVIRISDGSLLGTEVLAVIEQMAAAGDYQIWMEVVDETGKVGIVIEDGQVKADNYAVPDTE